MDAEVVGGGGGGAGRGGGGGGAAASRALELLELSTMETRRWEGVTAFGFAEAGEALVVKKRAVDSDAEYDGTDVVVRYLGSGVEELFSYVDEWGLDEPGGRLAYTLDGPDGEANAVKVLDLGTRIGEVLDAEREVTYAQLTWGSDEGEASEDALAVLKGSDDEDLEERENALLMWPDLSGERAPVVLDPRPEEEEDEGGDAQDSGGSEDVSSRGAVNGFPEGWVLSEGGALRWAPDASKLFVATKPQLAVATELCTPADDEEDGGEEAGEGASDEVDAEEDSKDPPVLAVRVGPDGRPLGPEELLDGECPEFIANVDIWHVQDVRIQSIQEGRVNQDRNRTYQSVVHVDPTASGPGEPRYVQLADQTMETLQISDDASRVMGRDAREYISDWKPGYGDHYLVDLETGARTLVLEGHLRTLGFSPDGAEYLYWQDRQVWSYETESGEHASLTEGVSVTFENEQFDRFGEKPPHGIAGWTTDGESVILQHRYDLWLQPLDGGTATNLTKGVGAERELRLRIIDMDPDEDDIDLDGPLYLSAYGEWTKQTGFYKLDGGKIEALVMADARIANPRKADDADVLLWTRQTFEQFPDYWVSGLDFQDPVRVTDANPQQSEYNWGRRVLFDYETHDGVRLQGTLAIPYDYVQGEKRPMIINYYEKNSQNLHSYAGPRYAGSPNFAGYVSAGYLVMQPDVHFRIGPSHSEMLESIELAIDVVEEMGYVDPDRIGLHGHSYSGQGSTYISTHSDRFAAIVAGAAATNLVSDFNALWGGANNAHNYDIYGQGRLGVGLYDDFDLYVDQSAVHHAEDMNTPLLLLHGTDDQTVRWMHAVEFYNGLRWFDKNVVLLSYPGEGHGLRQYENQKDFQIRMRQFFDHYLRDQPAARWMDDGRTFVEKERSRAMMERDSGGSGSGGSGSGGSGSGGS